MSNRIRVLFHCALEGQVAHVGQKALRAMEHLASMPRKTDREKNAKGPLEWIPQQEWQRRGKPFYTERLLDSNPFNGGYTYIYHVLLLGAKPSVPPPLDLLGRVKWLWDRLPMDLRKHCQLVVTRENRYNKWPRSLANPSRHGWRKASSKTPNKAPTTATGALFGSGLSYSWGLPGDAFYPPAPEPVQNSLPEVEPGLAPGLLAAAAGVQATLGAQTAPAAQAYASYKANVRKVVQKAHEAAAPSHKASYKSPGFKPPSHDDEVPAIDAPSGPMPAVLSKPKLKLGIWS